ncbi:hypothetical protein FRB94_002104 [Tulasnella sp. JGI-2019a]|nr:hypothetical protein FRB94_002104 [Tulasnella sp. JGI-2019a]
MPSALIHKASNNHESMPFSGDRVFEKFFEEVIASPELTLLDDVPQDIDQKPQIHLPPPYPTVPHPYLHRLQVLPSGPPMGVLKSNPYHIHHQPITTTPPSSGGGISPDLTWSGDPSPISPNDSPNLLTVDDDLDLEGEEFKAPLFTPFTVSPQSTANSQSPPSSGKRSSGRGRNASRGQNNSGASTHSRASSRSRSLRSNSSSIGASDELTMSDLSLHHQHGAGTTSLRALLSCPPSPTGGHASPAVQLATSAPPRKKARTSSRSSETSVLDVLLNPDSMGQHPTRLVPTGHRRNITSSALVPLNAPTQVRNYLTPSSTSKKEIPSAFVARRNKLKAKESAVKATVASATVAGGSTAGSSGAGSSVAAGRKRSRSQAASDDGDGEDDGVDELQDDDTPMAGAGGGGSSTGGTAPTRPGVSTATANDGPHEPTSPTTTTSPMEDLSQESSSLLSAIEAKRRQNTLAARRSRQRKLDYVRNLEELLAAMTKERNLWKARAEKAEKVLGYRPGEDDEDEEEQEAE